MTTKTYPAQPSPVGGRGSSRLVRIQADVPGVYTRNDLFMLHSLQLSVPSQTTCLRSLEELLQRDRQREEDGFPRKIKVGRLIRPGRGEKAKVSVVPTTVEEKFYHDRIRPKDEETQSGGSGEGEEGEVVGEQPIHEPGAEGAGGAGEGQSAAHDLESDAYDLGRILTEAFELPNLQDKGKKRTLSRFTYDLTDKHQGSGQLLDKKSTMRRILETNLNLGNIPDVNNIDPSRFLVAPRDRVFRVFSKEKEYESQALVFFLRDYSGSMWGKPTETVVAQHVLIYSWLVYQYARQVETRFILHDTEAKEVQDFATYANLRVAGGTRVASAYRMVNDLIETDRLYQDYNIYVFHGTDGDDWDRSGQETLPDLEKMLTYANRVGITIAGNMSRNDSNLESMLHSSKLLRTQRRKLRLDSVESAADEQRLIQGIRRLIAEEEAVA